MERNRFRRSWFITITFWLLFQPSPGKGFATEVEVRDENGAMELNIRGDDIDLKGRMERIEAKSQHQEKENEALKYQLAEEKKFSRQLGSRLSQLEASAIPVSTKNEKLVERSKRPYRLHPPNVPIIEKEKNESGKNPPFYGPARNCNELMLLGYTLNGYYLIKKVNSKKNNKKIGVVFCQFQQPLFQKQSFLETSIGNLKIQTKTIHFYLQRNTTFPKNNAVIPFQVERLNVGNAMNLASGVFTVPVPGIYHFQVVALKDKSSSSSLTIFLKVNDYNVAVAETIPAAGSFRSSYDTVSLTAASLRLKTKDKVRLVLGKGVIFDSNAHHTQFTGWLVEEEL